jgi:hypothetical protein
MNALIGRPFYYAQSSIYMGDHDILAEHNEAQAKLFMQALLPDLAALEKMIDAGRIEGGMTPLEVSDEEMKALLAFLNSLR